MSNASFLLTNELLIALLAILEALGRTTLSAICNGIPLAPLNASEALFNLLIPATLPAHPNGPDNIPGANPIKCPIFLAIASYSLSGAFFIGLKVVKPSINPPAI